MTDRTALTTNGGAWHVITCEYPPQIGGVSDCSWALARALSERGHETHVWCPAAGGDEAPTGSIVVHRTLGNFGIGDLQRTGAQLNAIPGPKRLFVQWVPHGYGWHSVNLPFAVWLAWRAWRHGDELHVMIHEPFLRFSPNPVHIAMAALHRAMLAAVCAGAARVWVSIPAWSNDIRPYVPARVPRDWLPIPAPDMDEPTRPATLATPTLQEGPLVVGHFGTYSELIRPLLMRAVQAVLKRSSAHVLLIGRESDAFRAEFLEAHPHFSARIAATGTISKAELRRAICSCAVLVQPYPDGISARRTSALALLANGRAVVTNAGSLTEPMWAASGAVWLVPSPDGERLGDAAASLLHRQEDRERLADRARDFYERTFDVGHSVARLEAAMQPPAHGHEVHAKSPVLR
jgi:glycosyltransferase involved in cell wall biosynthesis